MTYGMTCANALASLGAAWLLTTGVVAQAQEQLPVEAFFAKPNIGAVRLSPSGRTIAVEIRDERGRVNLAVADVEQPRKMRILVADANLDVSRVRWVNDDWLVFQLVDEQTGGGDQAYGPGLLTIRKDGGNLRVLLNPKYSQAGQTGTIIHSQLLDWRNRFLGTLHNGGTDVVIGEYRFDGRQEVESVHPKLLDVATGRSRSETSGEPPFATEWWFDEDGDARVVASEHAGIYEVFWHARGASDWKSIGRFPDYERQWSPEGIDAEGHLYVVVGSSRLARFDFDTGKPGAVIASTPGFDFDGELVMDEGKLAGLRLSTDAETSVWFQPWRKKLQDVADAHFPGNINRTTCSKCEGDGAMLVYSYSDRDPGAWWLYQPKTDHWSPVGSARPQIDPRRMALLDFHRVKARDGLEFPVWTTTPAGKSSSPRPAVVLVHGGPWVRGVEWKWDAEAQFLASRGYVVIQPEYRGSTGYGFGLFKAGWKNWGTSMQDDVADSVQWAVAQKLVDPARICIAGASYGGYATLMGVIRFPDLYRCGVAWAAVTDPRLRYEESVLSDSTREVREYSLPLLVGDPVQDAAMLKAAAPVERAAEIRVPMLLAFGGSDVRVPIEHGDRMRAAMRAAGQEPEYIVYQDEAHGWLTSRHEVDFWKRVEKFLAKNLGN